MRGKLLVVSAPSGAGKSTILREVLAQTPALAFSVSHTTRAPRPGERDGVDYHFVSRETFLTMREAGAFLESAEVHGNGYGTGRQGVEAALASGVDIILDIDVQGARQVRQAMPEALTVFIVPPSWEELERRLRGRGTESEDKVRLRLANARQEVEEAPLYNFVVVNDRLDEAVTAFRSILLAERCRGRRGLDGRELAFPGIGRHD